MTVIGSTNKNVFETYVEQILVPQLWPGAIVLMDNLSVHTAVFISVDHSRDVSLRDMQYIFVMQHPYKVLVMMM
jgi:transposase